MDPVTIGMALAKYGPAVVGAFQSVFGHRQTVDWGELSQWVDGMKAQGYITPQDQAAADMTQSRLNESADASGKMLTEDAQTRMRQRGIDTAPAAEATLARISQATARGRQQAGDTAASQLYDAFNNNKNFDAAKKLALIQGRVGGAPMEAYGANAQRAGTINSLLQSIPGLIPKSGGQSTTAMPISPGDPNFGVTPPAASPNPVPNDVASGIPSAAQRMAGAAGAMPGRKYKFNPATGGFTFDTQPDYATSGSALDGGGWSGF